MKITKQRLKEIIREELINESPEGRAQMHAKGLSKDALRVVSSLKKGDIDKARYFIKDIIDSLKEVEKYTRKNDAAYLSLKKGPLKFTEGKLNEGPKFDEVKANMEKTMGLLVRKMGLKSVGRHLVGKGGMSFFLDDPKEAKKLQKYLQAKIKDVRLINLDKEGGDEANFVVYAKVFDF